MGENQSGKTLGMNDYPLNECETAKPKCAVSLSLAKPIVIHMEV